MAVSQNVPHGNIIEFVPTISFSQHVNCSVKTLIEPVSMLHAQVNIIEFLTFTVHDWPLTRYHVFVTKKTVRYVVEPFCNRVYKHLNFKFQSRKSG